MITGNMTDFAADSVINIVDTTTGYPEISYFRIALLIPAILGNKELYNRFSQIYLYKSTEDRNVNYEHLFNITDENGNDPGESSLFNV